MTKLALIVFGVLTLAVSPILTGCRSTSDAQADLVEGLVREGTYSREEADCFVQAVDRSIGLERLRAPGALSEAELNELSDISQRCSSSRLASTRPLGGASVAAAAAQTDTPRELSASEAAAVRSTAIDELRAFGGYTAAVAQCTVDALIVALGIESLLPAAADDPQVIEARAQILQQCRARK